MFVVALACAFTVHDHNTHIASTIRGLKLPLPQTTTSSHHQLQGLTECVAAIQAIPQASQCPVFNIFNDSYSFNYTTLNTMIAAHCDPAPTSCRSMLDQALINVLLACNNTVIGEQPSLWIDIGALLVVNHVPCLNDNAGHWCFAEFKQFADRLAAADTNPLTAADLSAGCTNCTTAVLLAWIAFEPSFDAIYTTSTFDLICSNAGGEWCFLEFQQAVMALTNATDAEKVQRAPLYCKPCTFVYLFKWKSLIEFANNHLHTMDEAFRNASTIVMYVSWLCVKDQGGNYCNGIFTGYDFGPVTVACADSGLTGGPGCSANCKAAVQKVVADFGCCLQTWLDFLAFGCYVNNNVCPANANPATIRALVHDLCMVEIPAGCQRRRTLSAVVRIQNLGWLWCQANIPQCLELVHIAIAQQFLLDVADIRAAITMGNLQPATTPHRRLLAADSDVMVNVAGVNNAIGSVSTDNQANSVTVSGVPGQAKPDLNAPTTTLVLEATVTNSAAGIVPSISLALLAMLLLFV